MRIFLLLCATFLSCKLYSQSIYMKLSSLKDKDGTNFLIFNQDTRTAKNVHCSYSILKGTMIDFMVKWGVGNDGMIYWTNGENIYKFNPSNESNKIVVAKLYSILEFAIRDTFAFVAYNPSDFNSEDDGRYSPGVKLMKINLKNGSKEQLYLPGNVNITNLSVSKGGSLVCFIDSKYIDDEKRTKYFLKVYNLKTKEFKVIDSAKYSRYEWFGSAEKFNTSVWLNDSTICYYKNVNKDTNGRLIEFNLTTNTKRTILNNIPQRDFSWFSYFNGKSFFSSRFTLYFTTDGVKKDEVYSIKNDGIHEALIL